MLCSHTSYVAGSDHPSAQTGKNEDLSCVTFTASKKKEDDIEELNHNSASRMTEINVQSFECPLEIPRLERARLLLIRRCKETCSPAKEKHIMNRSLFMIPGTYQPL